HRAMLASAPPMNVSSPLPDDGPPPSEITAGDGPGRLSVVATPIGHLDDLSPRARRALEQADLVACEDTRRSGRLMAHLGLRKRLVSMHDHNEHRRLPQLLDALEQGLRVAVISDAGTPLLSDPGFPLVRAAAERGLPVEAIPGPSSILAALVASALPPYPFSFAGFPPNRTKRRRSFYRQWGEMGHTVVVFESPHRLLSSLADARAELGDGRPAAVCRELTKLHEEVLRGDLKDVHDALAARPSLKGEFVLVLGAPPKAGRGAS
ncbi:MAG: 16S rRNA (cytidine(1402)-2'-O)-methyltransferase, partial [Holophagales bacterium]|nr:16S rRNA (cytidine(1402)-2'-O)-methyltransferase [Holophagales bacterium]